MAKNTAPNILLAVSVILIAGGLTLNSVEEVLTYLTLQSTQNLLNSLADGVTNGNITIPISGLEHATLQVQTATQGTLNSIYTTAITTIGFLGGCGASIWRWRNDRQLAAEQNEASLNSYIVN